MSEEYPFIIHAWGPSNECGLCPGSDECEEFHSEDHEEDYEDEDSIFATHTHGLENVGMLEIIVCGNDEIDSGAEACFINTIYDYYNSNRNIYEEFLEKEVDFHHFHPEESPEETDFVVGAAIMPGTDGVAYYAYEGTNVEDKEFIVLDIFTIEQWAKFEMQSNIEDISENM